MSKEKGVKKPANYSSGYIAGLGVGLALFASYLFLGTGLGASGTTNRIIVAIQKFFSPEHVNNNPFLARYGAGDLNPLADWVVFLVIGVAIGAFVSGFLANRVKLETNRGPNITDRQRWIYAIIGGILFGFGAKLARGCASGLIMTGGATMSVGAWATMLVWMGTSFLVAQFIRKLWL